MAYEIYFEINEQRAKIDRTFTQEATAQEVADGLRKEGYTTEVVDLNQEL